MDEDELVPAVRAAHAIDQPARRGGRPGLTLERIVEAAVAIAGEEGLAAVSMAKVASRLGFTTMSLYRHVGSKDELLTHMQDAALPAPPVDLAVAGDWREGLRRWTEAQVLGGIEHPWALEIPVTGPPLMPNSLAWIEAAMELMAELPLRGAEKLALVSMLAGHARSEATMAVNMQSTYRERGIVEQDQAPAYERALLRVAAADRFPQLHAIAAAGELFAVPSDAGDPDAHYANFPIERILDGVAAYIERRQNLDSRT